MSNFFQRRAGKNARQPLVIQGERPDAEILDEATVANIATTQNEFDAVVWPDPVFGQAPAEVPAVFGHPSVIVPVDQWDAPISAPFEAIAADTIQPVSEEAETRWSKEDTTPSDAALTELALQESALPEVALPQDTIALEPVVAPVPSAADFFGYGAAFDERSDWDQPVAVVSDEAEELPEDEVPADDALALFELTELDDVEEPGSHDTGVKATRGRHAAPVEDIEPEQVTETVVDYPAEDALEHETPVNEMRLEPVPEPTSAELATQSDAIASHAEVLTQTAWTISQFARTQSPPAQEVISFEAASLSMHTAEISYQYAVFNGVGEVELVTHDVSEVLAHISTRISVPGEPQPLVQARAIRADYWRTLDWGQGSMG
jgi:hypothetical protein